MSKLLVAMRANPKGNWQAADVKALCDELGILCEPPRGGGSHFKIGHAAIQHKLTIPFKKPIKPVYIRLLVAFVDELIRPHDES